MLTKQQLAKQLNVSVSMIDKLMKKGMPYLKIGKAVRFDLEKVLVWIKEQK